jgi:NAD-dependent dihydropyrimidine dehydrogenase PreA subunit
MGIRKIDYELCTGCGLCVESCQTDVLRLDEEREKAYIAYLRDCQSCYFCEYSCPEEAIYVTPERERRVPHPWNPLLRDNVRVS